MDSPVRCRWRDRGSQRDPLWGAACGVSICGTVARPRGDRHAAPLPATDIRQDKGAQSWRGEGENGRGPAVIPTDRAELYVVAGEAGGVPRPCEGFQVAAAPIVVG